MPIIASITSAVTNPAQIPADPISGPYEVTSYEYDANGNKTAEIDALTRRTTFEYDAKNRPIKTIHPDLTFTTTTYDFRDKPLTVTDELGRVPNAPTRIE